MADAKQGKNPVEEFCNGSSQTRVVLAKPRLGGFSASGFGSSSNKTSNPFGSVLRPPQLKAGSNVFTKVKEPSSSDADKDKDSSADDRLKDNKDAEAPIFVPLGNNVTPRSANPVPAPPQSNTAASSSGFVFGQNLSARVVMNENVNNGDAAAEHSSTNGTNELLFSSAAASVKDNGQPEPSNEQQSSGEGLAAAAAEYERSHARPPPPTSNVTMTGEEDEINVLQMSCRLFAWEAGGWRERGRGVVRLNDGDNNTARLVARQAGSLRVLLNTKLWPEMVVERPAAKSLRITACDAQCQVKLFLIMGAPGDIAQLNRALLSRVTTLKKAASSQSSSSNKAAERLEAINENDFPDAKDIPETEDSDSKSVNDRLDDDAKETENVEDTENIQETESKSLKRKEPADDETSPKRQCPEV